MKSSNQLNSFFFFFFLHSGFIKNTEKLNYSKERMYKLTVTAYDCGKNRASEDVLVKINIKPTCKPGWQGSKGPTLSVTLKRLQDLLVCGTPRLKFTVYHWKEVVQPSSLSSLS